MNIILKEKINSPKKYCKHINRLKLAVNSPFGKNQRDFYLT